MKLKKDQVDIMTYDAMKNATEDRKLKKFFRWAIPVLVVEIVLSVVGLVIYLAIPKNYCKLNSSPVGSVVYINGEITNKVRFKPPERESKYYYYEIPVEIILPEQGEEYELTFTVTCKKYRVSVADTVAQKEKDVYFLTALGGEKTKLFHGLTIFADEMIKNFTITINIDAKII